MFEAIHGSAPRRAGQNLANPSGLLLGGVMMLVHIGQADIAERVHNAWLRTLEDGIHTYDIFSEGVSKQKVGTKEFAQAVVARVGKEPEKLAKVKYNKSTGAAAPIKVTPVIPAKKVLVGVDVFLHTRLPISTLVEKLMPLAPAGLKFTMLTNRGVKVWPDGPPAPFCTDHYRARYESAAKPLDPIQHKQIIEVLGKVDAAGFDFIKTENLYTFDGEPGFTRSESE
jgi:isocitrate dehydrogenase